TCSAISPEEEALATVDAAWDAGTRYFDTAPFYGAGLSEMRLGKALSKRPRDEYILSTKVRRLILDEVEDPSSRDQGEIVRAPSRCDAPCRALYAARSQNGASAPHACRAGEESRYYRWWPKYGAVPPEIAVTLEKIKALCLKHDLPIKAAALQFS